MNNLEINCPEFDIEGVIENLEKLSEIANIPESEFTASHNVLLADNFVLIEDGHRGKYWEYAGMAPRYYDLADMFLGILVPRKVEAFWKIIKNEFFYPNSFYSIKDLIYNLGNFLFEYNYLRKHGGLTYITLHEKLEKVTELLS